MNEKKSLQKLLGQLEAEKNEAQSIYEEMNNRLQLWKKCEQFLDNSCFFQAKRFVEENCKRMSSDQTLQEIIQHCDLSIQKMKPVFPRLLAEAAKEAEITIDQKSHHPDYCFESGLITVNIDLHNGKATLETPGTKRSRPIDADVQNVVKKIQEECRRLKSDRNVNLHEAIQIRICRDKNPTIAINALYKEVKQEYPKYRFDEFIVDLSKVATEGSLWPDGSQLNFLQTRDSSEGIHLIGAENRGYVSHITIQGEEQ